MHDGRVVALVDEVGASDRLDAERRLAEVQLAAPVVEVERREPVARQSAADADRRSAEEAQLVAGDGGAQQRRALGVHGSHGADLVTDRVQVDGSVQQAPVL